LSAKSNTHSKMHIPGVLALVIVTGILSVDSLAGLAVTVGLEGAEV